MGKQISNAGICIRPSQWLNFVAYLTASCSFLLLVYIFPEMTRTLGGWSAGMLLVPSVFALYKYAEVQTTMYHLNSGSLVLESGVFDVTLYDCPWWRVKSISVERPLFYRIIGLSNIYLLTSDTFKPSVEMLAIADADRVLEQIKAMVNEGRRGQRVRELEIFREN